MRPSRNRFRVEYASGFESVHRVLMSGWNFWLDFKAFARFFSTDLPPHLVDLLRLSSAISAVDRLVRRVRRSSPGWGRNLLVRVEILDPEFWSSSELVDALQQAVEFVSGDSWDFEFFRGKAPYERRRSLFLNDPVSQSPMVCLYSGGLDSAAGLGLRLPDNPDRPVIPVIVKHQPGQMNLIGNQFNRLKARYGAMLNPLVVQFDMDRPRGVKWEPSHRARSMLFASIGVVAAALAGESTVEVFESGVGALNIPLMAGMTGSKATRGCHPEFLRRMSRLGSLVAGREVTFRLPFSGWTKGEMVRSLNEVGLAELTRDTVSCVRFPLGYHRYKQCGICPGCLFRRQAMIVGGVEEPEDSYSFDLFGTPERASLVPAEKLEFLKAFLMQVASWVDVEVIGGLPDPVERHLRHTGILRQGEPSEAVIALLALNRDEWLAITSEARRKGLPWAGLLDRKLDRQGASHAHA